MDEKMLDFWFKNIMIADHDKESQIYWGYGGDSDLVGLELAGQAQGGRHFDFYILSIWLFPIFKEFKL